MADKVLKTKLDKHSRARRPGDAGAGESRCPGLARIAVAEIAGAGIAVAGIAVEEIAVEGIAVAEIAVAEIAVAEIAVAEIAVAEIAVAGPRSAPVGPRHRRAGSSARTAPIAPDFVPRPLSPPSTYPPPYLPL